MTNTKYGEFIDGVKDGVLHSVELDADGNVVGMFVAFRGVGYSGLPTDLLVRRNQESITLNARMRARAELASPVIADTLQVWTADSARRLARVLTLYAEQLDQIEAARATAGVETGDGGSDEQPFAN